MRFLHLWNGNLFYFYMKAFLGNNLLLTICPGISDCFEVLNAFTVGFCIIVSLLLLLCGEAEDPAFSTGLIRVDPPGRSGRCVADNGEYG
jgi:hypothetical protein